MKILVKWYKNVLSAWMFLPFLAFASGVSLDGFFSFGKAYGDVKLSANKSNHFGNVLILNGSYFFYKKAFNTLQIHGEGLITLGKETFVNTALRHRKFPFPPNTPSIAVFYAPIQIYDNSEVFYRETRNQDDLERATNYARSSFVEDTTFSASHVFIATWNNVTRASTIFPNKVNTFQVVLMTDRLTTFALFSYKHDGLQWIKGYHVRFQGGRFFNAQVGFSAGDQIRYYLLPGSGTRDVKLLSFKSNMMLPGQWMFKIGRPNMGPFNVESADSFSQKGSLTPLYFNVDQYVTGCFKVQGYFLSNESEIWEDVGIRACMILCHERNYIYAALYNGNQCTCLNPLEYKKLDILPSEACDVPCVENDELTCGGKAAASVFLAVASSIVSSDEGVAALKDMDECASGVSQCHPDAFCKNSDPGHCCECNEGYFGNGVICEKEGENVRLNGRMTGNLNGIDLISIVIDVIGMTKDGRVYVVIRNPPAGLEHSLKILTPFANLLGWTFAVKKVVGVPNGFSLIGDKFTRSVVISFNSGEKLYLNQTFTGKDSTGRFIAMETTLNGTMPNINAEAVVKMNSFKEIYRREDRGRVESDGAVTFEVNGQAIDFSVLQRIDYDELKGCDTDFYSFDVESKVLMSRYDTGQKYSAVAIRSFIVNASSSEVQKQEGNINDCGVSKKKCHLKASCVKEQGSEQCRCDDGYEGDGVQCEPYRCPQECSPDGQCMESSGTWNCVCNAGFRGNGVTCEPDGTCAGVRCSERAQCLYADDNSRKCICNVGYQGDGQNCAPLDKCEGVQCGRNASCDEAGKCACHQGFQGDGLLCKDVDECDDSVRECHSDANCTNNVGSYLCQCKDGYRGDGFTCEKEEVRFSCADRNCHSQAKCVDNKCVCNNGYQGDGVTCTVTPIGGCNGQKCHIYASCFADPSNGKESCGCRLGFLGDGLKCEDLDECANMLDFCPDNKTQCINTLGSFECLCKEGFMEVNRKCVSDDTCMGVECDPNALCDPFRGCLCKPGYQGNGKTCLDEDECDPSRSPCDLNATCTNTAGSYHCQCRAGFTGDGTRCQRVGSLVDEECNGAVCDTHAQCIQPYDQPMQCECEQGWQGNGQTCSDVDECEVNYCHPLRADCINTAGSYECRCKPGFEGDGINCTSDGSCHGVRCHDNATCFKPTTEVPGLCICKDGWIGNGRHCHDVDECNNSSKNSCHKRADCINTEGSYNCRCKTGYQGDGFDCVADGTCDGVICGENSKCLPRASKSRERHCVCDNGWTGDGRSCVDMDECESSSVNCDQNADCFNSVGSYQCRCRLGYQGNGTNCVSDGTCDGVVCDLNSVCVPRSSGSRERKCVCKVGWTGDGQNCTDINECESPTLNCDQNADCLNSAGSYQCRCRLGYQGNGTDCISDGTCDGVVCDSNSVCVPRSSGSRERKCVCKVGWTGDGQNCTDINECELPAVNCDLNADCFNSAGSYQCRCRLGYRGKGTDCVSDGTCDGVLCDPNSVCTPRTSGHRERKCVCKVGWTGDGKLNCTDVNECESPAVNCDRNADCINSAGSYHCRCRLGYQGNGTTCLSDGTCDGVVCDPNGVCVPRASGSRERKCVCMDGWTGDGRNCADINECETPDVKCHLNADCFNGAGSFQCRCRFGYQGNGSYCVSDGTCDGIVCDENSVCVPRASGSREQQCVCNNGWTGDGRSCTDIDECHYVNNGCHQHAYCFNSPGSFSCQCKLGYQGSGLQCLSDGTCAGVACHSNATCRNTIQGRRCVCNGGYQGDGTTCSDINECLADKNDCDTNADCVNIIGSYSCQCKPGYKGTGFLCKSDGTCAGVRCHPDALCGWEVGLGSVCVCKPGYQGDGRKCSDIDECARNDQKCHQEAECVNTVGSYNCSCKLGFEGDGISCKTDGTCAGIVCATDAECVTVPTKSTICQCKAGFIGDGLDCRDIDECAQKTHKCHRKSKCRNRHGSYECRCNPGYYGSGFNCSSDGTCEGVVCDLNADCVALNNFFDPDKECRCKPGFTGKGDICKDLDECEDPSVCPDKANCFNMAGSFMCYCLPGYKMIAKTCIKDCNICLNGGSCGENNTCVCPPGFSGKRCQWHGDASLIYSRGNSIQRMSLPPRPNNIGIIYQRAGAMHVGVDYDCIEQRVYWTEVTKGVIVRAKYDGSEMEVVVHNGKSASPEGIAVDWLGRNIYWTDSRHAVIQVAKLDGSKRRTLVSSGLGNPRAIIVDPPNGKMYWADWNRNQPKIELANMDGSDRRVLVKSPLSLPNGLTLVHSTNELCYSDAGMWSISCVNLGDLSMRKAYNPAPYPFGITNFNRTLFWTDWKLGRIQRIGMHSRFPDKPLRSFVGSSGKIFDIKAVQPCGKRTVASYPNPCAIDNGGCSSLCLLNSKSYSCSCPDGLFPVKTGNAINCEAKCQSALGMETGVIKNKQVSAHSAWNNDHLQFGGSRARLHLGSWPPGWKAQKNDPSPWLQIDLLQVQTVTAVATQGYGDEKEQEWVKTYVLMVSRDGERWNSYKEGGNQRVFMGNKNTKSVVQNRLKMPVTTRWLRIVPRSWNNHIGMRVELYGC